MAAASLCRALERLAEAWMPAAPDEPGGADNEPEPAALKVGDRVTWFNFQTGAQMFGRIEGTFIDEANGERVAALSPGQGYQHDFLTVRALTPAPETP